MTTKDTTVRFRCDPAWHTAHLGDIAPRETSSFIRGAVEAARGSGVALFVTVPLYAGQAATLDGLLEEGEGYADALVRLSGLAKPRSAD